MWYNLNMTAKINDDLQKAVDAQVDEPVAAEHEGTHKMYYIYNEQLHQKAMRAMKAIEDDEAIAEGLRQMENNEGRPLHEVDADMRRDFDLPTRQ